MGNEKFFPSNGKHKAILPTHYNNIEILVICTVDTLFLYLNSNKLNRMKVSNVNNNSLYK